MLPVKNVRYIVFTCCVVLATVHIVYLWTLLHKLPSNTARYSLGGLARRAFHTNERLETSLPATQYLPEATLVCQDIQPPTGQCKDALQQGLCYGDVLTHCMSTCGQCGMLKSVARQAINIRIKEADELECRDESADCKEFVVRDKCDTQPLIGIARCKASCGFCQQENPPGTAQGTRDTCQDRLDLCPYLATSKQLCGSPDDSVWMQALCRASCGGCSTSQGVSSSKLHQLSRLRRLAGDGECTDFHAECPKWAEDNRCTYNRAFMQAHCRLSCNLCGTAQVVYGTPKPDWKVGLDAAGRWVIATSQTSLGQTTGGVKGSLAGECKDEFTSCSFWAMQGECNKNPSYMLQSCRLSCNACQTQIDYGDPGSSGASTGQVPMVPFTYFAGALHQVQLNNGVLMPTIGLGTAGLGEGTQQAVASALSVGYRHIDSAQAREWYREDLVGKGLGNYLSVPRADLFITTKIHPRHLGFEETLAAFSQSMVDLNTDYVDLLLLHYPSCWGDLCKALPGAADPPAHASSGPRTYKETWRAFEQLYLANKTRAIGVSNFNPMELQELYKAAKIKPQVLQAHMDPFAQNRDLQSMCKANGIQMVAYSSLGTQWHTKGGNPVLNHPTLQAIAKAVNRTVAQVVLRWVLHMGVLAIPRSSNTEHMKESLEILDFSLNEAQIAQIMMLEGFVKND